MESKLKAVVLLLSISFFAVLVVAAQHPEHHPAASTRQDQSQADGSCAQMMAHHREMQNLSDRLMDSFKAIEQERDPKAMEKKMAEHRALLEKLQVEMKRCGQMAGQTDHEGKMCSMMSSKHTDK